MNPTPETLRRSVDPVRPWNDKVSLDTVAAADAATDAWKADRKRLEAAEKALRQIATMTNDMSADGQFTAGDAYYAQHLAAAALAGEETK